MEYRDYRKPNRQKPEYYSDTVVTRLGRIPQCFKCGKDAVKVGDTWVCPDCDKEADELQKEEAEEYLTEDKGLIMPEYYKHGEHQCKEYIKASMTAEQYQGFLKGNVEKYLWRYNEKGGKDDLKKALFYLQELIEHYKK